MEDFDHVMLQKRLYSPAICLLILLYLKLENIFTLLFPILSIKLSKGSANVLCIVKLSRALVWGSKSYAI